MIHTEKEKRLVLKDESSGFERHLLSPTFPSKGIEFIMNILPVGARTGAFPAHQKNVQEYIYVDKGRLQVILGGSDTFILNSGDSFYFEANIEHEFINHGEEICRYFLVIDPHRQFSDN